MLGKAKEKAYRYLQDGRSVYYHTKSGLTFSITEAYPEPFIMFYGNTMTDNGQHRQATKKDLKNIEFVD